MRQKDVTSDDLRRLGLWLTLEEPQLRTVLHQAVETVLVVSNAEFWKRAAKDEHSVETPFAYDIGDKGVVLGVVDLMFRDAEVWCIVDYKTDLERTNLAASYVHQLKMYERALASVGITKIVSGIQSIRLKPGEP